MGGTGKQNGVFPHKSDIFAAFFAASFLTSRERMRARGKKGFGKSMKKSLIALALGTLALGISEYVMMAILQDVARDLNISIPTAGHLISAYAIGVSVGAPLLVFAHRYRPKTILMVLAATMVAGAVMSVLSPNYEVFLVARFVSGLPHGAYFGVASIVAVQLADERHKAGAVSVMIAGMTVANLFGVPLASALCAHLSWKFPFILATFCGLLTFYCLWKWLPRMPALPDASFKSQFRFLKFRGPWLILAATMLGNGGIFCWYSYITPLLTEEGGFPAESVSALMIAAGFGMVVGNLASGRLSDRFQAARVASYTQVLAAVALLSIFFLATFGWASACLMVVCAACLFAVSGPEQYLILKYARGGEMLGGACIQMAFNLGNALGAFVGGLPIAAGLSSRYSALTGVPFAVAGFLCLLTLWKKHE